MHAVIVLRQQADLLLGRMHMADGLDWKALDPLPALGPVLAARQQAVHLQRLYTGQICVSVQSDDALQYTFIDTKTTAVRPPYVWQTKNHGALGTSCDTCKPSWMSLPHCMQ